MQAEFGPRLAVDYGAATTAAVLVWPDGHWSVLTFDGAPVLSSSVYIEPTGEIVAGRDAWQRAAENPQRLVASPLRAGSGLMSVDGVEVSAQDAVAATLRRVADEAVQLVGGPVSDVRLVVPAGWGPKRRTWMRQAAYRAGLGQPSLVDAPVAAADQLLAQGLQLPVGAFVMVCDAGAGFEVTVLRRGPSGFEVLSTLDDADAGGDRVDELLAASMTAADAAAGPVELSAADQLVVRTSARVAKEALVRAPAVTVPMPMPRPALVVNAEMLAQAATPVVQRAAQLCEDAVAAAELTADQLAGVYCIGGTAQLPALAEAVGQRLGVAPLVVSEPGMAAVFGATQSEAGTARQVQAPPAASMPVPPLRRLVAMAVPGVASLALVAHFLLTAYFGGTGSRTYRTEFTYLIANWGELATACIMVLVGCLTIGTALGAVVSGLDGSAARRLAGSGVSPAGSGILVAAALGTAVAGLYAVLGSLYLGVPTAPTLRWALLPIAPVVAIAVAVAVIASRWRRMPVQGWDGFLAFPVSSVVTVSVGTVLVQQAMQTAGIEVIGRLGGLLIGVGVAIALVSRWVLRAILALLLGVVMAAIVSWPGTGILAGIYAVAVTLWWTVRLWALIRSPIVEPARVPLASYAGAPLGG